MTTWAASQYTSIGEPQPRYVTRTREKQIGHHDFGGHKVHTWSYEGTLYFGPEVEDCASLSFYLSNEEAKDTVSLKFIVERIKDLGNCFGYHIVLENHADIAKSGVNLTMTPNPEKFLGENHVFFEKDQVEKNTKALTRFIINGGAQSKDGDAECSMQ
jgi:hypothetical protein